MKNFNFILIFGMLLCCMGCETMNKGAYTVGTGVGKATKVADSAAEGMVDGYMGQEDPADDPYQR